jgi:hypothetical protein
MKLNLHAHSDWSDGNDTMDGMVRASMEKGYSCCVLSDHDYCFFRDISQYWLTLEIPKENQIKRALEKFQRQLVMAEELQEKYNYPVIIGSEICFYGEEAALFGKESLLSWYGGDRFAAQVCLKNNDEAGFMALDFLKHEHAICLVHPCLRGVDCQTWMYKIFDAYEIMNHGQPWWPENIEMCKVLCKPGAKQVRGCDAHAATGLDYPCNEIDRIIHNEKELIEWIKK